MESKEGIEVPNNWEIGCDGIFPNKQKKEKERKRLNFNIGKKEFPTGITIL